MKKKSAYKEALKKHSNEEVLNMYRDSKLDLNKKEWDDLHKRIDKEKKTFHGFDYNMVIAFVLCLFVIFIASLFLDNSNHEKIKKCNELKGHTCTKYEIESMAADGNNNR